MGRGRDSSLNSYEQIRQIRYWRHTDYPFPFIGIYRDMVGGHVILELHGKDDTHGLVIIDFTSASAAKKQGWQIDPVNMDSLSDQKVNILRHLKRQHR